MIYANPRDAFKRSARKHVIAEELNIVVSSTRTMSLARAHQIERLKRRLRSLESQLS